MNVSELIKRRLVNQQISYTKFSTPKDLVAWMTAMQAQEYSMAKWAIGLRLPGSNDDIIEKAFNDGDILRTHLMRPTWHFVVPTDIRWMLELTAPQVKAVNAYYYRKCELDDEIFKRSKDIIIKALQGGKNLTRNTLKSELEQSGIIANGMRLSYIMMQAELEGVICSGPRQGKQFTYALLEERVPESKALDREEALMKLAMNYFRSRGPATIRDFAYWSGLSMMDAKAGALMIRPHFEKEIIDDMEYLFIPGTSTDNNNIQTAFLMPDYDEFGMSYKEHKAMSNPEGVAQAKQDESPSSYHMFVINGIVRGTWRQTITKKSVVIETTPFNKLTEKESQLLEKAINRYKEFIGYN